MGNLRGMSFAFELGERDSSWDDEEEIEDEKDLGLRGRVAKAVRKIAVRTITSFRKLHDCAVVVTPAYPNTSVDVRNLVDEAMAFGRHIGGTNDVVGTFVLPAPSRSAPKYGVYDGNEAKDMWARQDMLKRILED